MFSKVLSIKYFASASLVWHARMVINRSCLVMRFAYCLAVSAILLNSSVKLAHCVSLQGVSEVRSDAFNYWDSLLNFAVIGGTPILNGRVVSLKDGMQPTSEGNGGLIKFLHLHQGNIVGMGAFDQINGVFVGSFNEELGKIIRDRPSNKNSENCTQYSNDTSIHFPAPFSFWWFTTSEPRMR